MTSNGPSWPEPTGRPSDVPGPPPGGAAPAQPGAAQLPQNQTQAVPNYAPPSQSAQNYVPPTAQAEFSTGPYNQPFNAAGPVTPGGSGGGQRGVLIAGVIGGLLTLGIITGTALLLTGNDSPVTDPTIPTSETTTTESTSTTAKVRIGSTVSGIELLTGDCINYDTNAANITSFDLVACDTPHQAEISSQAEHPDAGGGFPGVDELHLWGGQRCRDATSEFLGTPVLETTLDATTLVPDFNEWADGLYRVSCLIQAADGGRLIESVAGIGSSYPRPSELAVTALRAGDCFVPIAPTTAYDLGVNDITMLAPCDGAHDGLFFGQGVLDVGTAAAFPGTEAVEAAAVELCNTEFTQYFGVDHEGFNYRFWSPDEALWTTADRSVHCAVIDEKGLPPTLDLASFRPMFELTLGDCFVFGPEETRADMRLDDQVRPVGCDEEHNGQLFGSSELPPTEDPFPGAKAIDDQLAQECITLFTDYVGISPFDSVSGDFTYWVPNETGWMNKDFRWGCALLTDEPRTGSIEATSA